MTSQQLQCFIYVAERLNFTKAAEALYLSVPTVTHHIKNLEEEIGTQLFYRNSRIVKLTEQGEKFYYDAKDIFLKIEDVKNQFQGSEQSESVLFRIGCMSEKEFTKIKPVLRQIKENYSYIRPKIIAKDFFDLKNLYENQQLELVIATYDLSNQGVYKRLFKYQSYAVMLPDHFLAKESSLTFDQIAEENLITLPPKSIPFIKGNKFQEFLALHAQDHIHIVSENEGESILLAKCGYGIALLPGFLVPKDDELICIPINNTKNIEYGLYYRNNDKHIRYFVNEFTKIFNNFN
ncbi:MAG: LysR family transcriptional regulator [Lachnospiraceae bacterium]|nr:LysR family transcriptional regulator [Lachnospiraceae bacterium]